VRVFSTTLLGCAERGGEAQDVTQRQADNVLDGQGVMGYREGGRLRPTTKILKLHVTYLAANPHIKIVGLLFAIVGS